MGVGQGEGVGRCGDKENAAVVASRRRRERWWRQGQGWGDRGDKKEKQAPGEEKGFAWVTVVKRRRRRVG